MPRALQFPAALASRLSWLGRSVERKKIAGRLAPMFCAAKVVADLSRYHRTLGHPRAIGRLRQALRQRNATPAEIACAAEATGEWTTMKHYVMALTCNA